MNLSGSLSEVNLAEFLQQICEKRLTGLLRARNAKGRSMLIEIAQGNIAVAVRGEGRRMRLGDLLVARGRINQEQLADALKAQRFHGRRFGEILVDIGYCSDNDIKECIRFQVEEEVSELLTWDDGVIEFKEGEALETDAEEGHVTTRLNVDATALILEAARRADKWRSVAKLIPSMNCVFRLTEHGQKLREAATRGGRKLLDLINESYNVEGIIGRTFVGRFGVMRALSELMQSVAIEEVPRGELAGFAESLKKRNRYEQAIGAYRRLMEIARDPGQRPQILREIADCEEALRTIAATERIEGTRVVPRKPPERPAPVEQAKAVIWRPATAVLVLVLVVLVGIAIFAVDRLKQIALPENLAAYQEAKVAAGRLIAKGDYRGARQVWEKFLSERSEGQGTEFARADLDDITKTYEGFVKKDLRRAGKFEAELDFARAIAAYDEIIEQYPDYSEIQDVLDRARAVKDKQAEMLKRLTEEELAKRLGDAEELEKLRRFSDALKIYREISRSGGGSAERAAAAIGRLEEKLRRALALFEAALAHEKIGDYSLALESYGEVVEEWPGSKWGREAKIHASNIKRRARLAKLLFEEANKLEKQGRNEQALRKYLIVAENYKGFDESEPARERMNALTGISRKAGDVLARAVAKERAGDLDGAFEAYKRALELFGGASSAKKVKLPVILHSVPPGAKVTMGGRNLGKTPLELKIGAYESGSMEMSLAGFEDHPLKYANVRRRSMVCHLRKKPIFVAELGLRVGGQALARGSRVYVPAGRSIVALKRFSGKEVWRRELFDPSELTEEAALPGRMTPKGGASYGDLRGRAALVGDRLFVAARDGRLHVLNAASGEVAGRIALKAPVDTGIETVSSDLLAGKTFGYAASWRGDLLGLDLAGGGELHWTRPAGGPIDRPGAVAGGLLCYGTTEGKLVAFSEVSGTKTWTIETKGRILTSPSGLGDLVAVYSEGDGLYLVAKDARVRHHKKFPARGEGWVVLGQRVVVLSHQSGALVGYSTDGLVELWRTTTDGAVSGLPVRSGDGGGRFYIGTRAGTVYCFAFEGGTLQWKFAAGSAISSPISVNDGALYFGTADGRFFALEVE